MSERTIAAQPKATAPLSPSRSSVLQRQCACGTHTSGGGQCAECSKKKLGLQRKLMIGASNDPLELEADRVADQMMVTPVPTANSGAPLRIQRTPGQSNGQMDAAPASVDQALAGPGRPLEPTLRQDMEQRFGHDFSTVRVHSGAAAEQSARDVNAHAYTAGHNMVFDAGRYEPGTHEGRRLIAHELTHVVQQSRSDGTQPGLLQRDGPKDSDAKKAARARVVAAMERLKRKYGLTNVSEENGAAWSESELRRIDAAFSKMTEDEEVMLQGVSLIRTDKLSVTRKGKTIPVSGMATGGVQIQLTQKGTRGNVPLHEVGHIIQSKVLRDAEARLRASQVGIALDAARIGFSLAAERARPKRFVGSADQVQSVQAFDVALSNVTTAADDFMRSDGTDLQARRDALHAAQLECEVARSPVEQFQSDPAIQTFLEGHDRQKDWVAAVEQWMDEKEKVLGPRKNLTAFVDIVKKHKLARRSFAPFTAYVESFWPDKPEEFFAESYATWRNNPGYMKANAKPLYDWFEKGGHWEPMEPPTKIAKKPIRQLMHEYTPVLEELVNEVEATFLPESAREMLSIFSFKVK